MEEMVEYEPPSEEVFRQPDLNTFEKGGRYG
jgi:hypothetical protein